MCSLIFNYVYFYLYSLHTVPSAGVQNLSGVNTSSTSLLISWDPPPFPDQNGIIRAYNISYGPTTDDSSLYNDTSTEEAMIELESLEKFTNYTVVVRPYTIGSGPEESVTVQTDSDCELVIEAVVNYRVIPFADLSYLSLYNQPLELSYPV